MPKAALASAIALLATFGAAAPARATTFTFSDEYFVSSLTTFHNIFGATATGYTTAGIYQETNTSIPIITRLGNGSSVPGEYVQDTTPNDNLELALFGWSKSLNNGQLVADVYNSNNPGNGTNTYFRYTVGGVTTPFTFDGFDLAGSVAAANLSFTLQGYLAGQLVDSAVLQVAGNTFSTYVENWVNVDTVVIASTATLPVNWSSGTLHMDNVVINVPFDTPEPPTFALTGAMLLAVGAYIRKGTLWRKG